jgi:hypothetical protein
MVVHRRHVSPSVLTVLAHVRTNPPFSSCSVCFATLFAIALYCTAWTIYLAVPHTAAGWRDISSLLDQSAFRVNSLSFLHFTYLSPLVHHHRTIAYSLLSYTMSIPKTHSATRTERC